MMTMIWILEDFKPIIDLDLYGEHMAEERITGSKIDLDLSARSTYTWVYMVIIAQSDMYVITRIKVNIDLYGIKDKSKI